MIKYEGNGAPEQSHDARHAPDKGFGRWLARRSAKARTNLTDDLAYSAYVAYLDASADANGRVHAGEPGGPDLVEDVGDDDIYARYLGVLSGETARKRAEATSRQEKLDKEGEIFRHAQQTGGGLPRNLEHLRDRLAKMVSRGEGTS